VILLAAALLSACAPAEVEPESLRTLAIDPESELGLPKPLGLEPIVREATHVLDESETSLVTSVTVLNAQSCRPEDPDRSSCLFRIAFSSLPPGISVGSVLVADVSDATPAGLLVTVTQIDGNSVHAEEAGLGDALEQGDGSVEKQFNGSDIAEEVLAAGVTPIAHGIAHMTGGSMQGEGDKEFNFAIDHVEIADGVFADGVASFDMGCGAYAGVSWEEYFGIPIYPNGVYFEAKCGASQAGALTISATKSTDVSYSKEIASFALDPITFYVIIPIVFVPHITVSVSASGKLTANMSFGASESFSANAGITYNDGFHAIKDFGYDVSAPTVVGSGRLSAEAGVTVSESLLLYDIAGPTMSETLYVNLKGSAFGESPLWCIRGGLRADASLVLETKVKDLVWGPEQLFDADKELGCAPNGGPTLEIETPYPGDYFPHGEPFPPRFTVTATDPEDGTLSPVWTSSKDGDLGVGTLVNPPLTLGTHVITATVTDSAGVTATQSVTIEVKEVKPEVSFQVKDANGIWQAMTSLSGAQGDVMYFRVVSTHPVPLVDENCADVSWTSSLPVAAIIGLCDYKITLSKQGSFSVKSTVTDAEGKSGSASFAVSVAAPPAVIAAQMSPILATKTAPWPPQSLTDGAVVDPGSTVSLNVEYLNEPAAKVSVRYDWWVKSASGSWTYISGTDGIPSTGSYRDWIAPNSGGSFEFKAQMINKSTGTVINVRTYKLSVPTPIK
jgi:hypothetical protein